MQIPKILIVLATLYICCGCSAVRLTARTEYLSNERLASYIVGTPDPKLNHPSIGQKLIVSWRVPREYPEAELHITMRYANNTKEELHVPISSITGTYIHEIRDDVYSETRGILTYKIDLLSDGCVITEWRHQLWSHLIEFSKDKGP